MVLRSQTTGGIRLDFNNRPLNEALQTLGLEISFNHTAMAAYTVSVAETFRSKDEALRWLLRDKPFTLERIGNVYVIVASDDKTGEGKDVAKGDVARHVSTITGRVIDFATGEGLEYATVSMLAADGQAFTATVTNGRGEFTLTTSRMPDRLKISYVGYETLLADPQDGVFALHETVFQLGETGITQMASGLNRTLYAITAAMRAGVENAMELAGRLPSVWYDKATATVRFNSHSTDVMLLVDGVQQPLDYLRHLAPERVKTVEVITSLSGRFVSDEYAAIINFMLEADYKGIDFHASGVATYAIDNQYEPWHNNSPSAGVSYSVGKVNLFASCAYGSERLALPAEKSQRYNAFEHASSFGEPNIYDRLTKHIASGRATYQLRPTQIFRFQSDYMADNVAEQIEYLMMKRGAVGSNGSNGSFTVNRTRAYSSTNTLAWQGRFGERLSVFADVSYIYYYNLIDNVFTPNIASNARYEDLYDELKHQTKANLEGKYIISNRLTVEAGYSNVWRRYSSESSIGARFLDYTEARNRLFAYIAYNLSATSAVKAGVAVEHTGVTNRSITTAYARALPYLRFSQRFSDKSSLVAAYYADMSYPALYQLSQMSLVVDTFVTAIGNPALLASVNHHAFAALTIWNRLTLTPRLDYSRDAISEVYSQMAYKLYRTFGNIDVRTYSLATDYEQPLGRFLNLKASLLLYHSRAMYESGSSNSLNGSLMQAELQGRFPLCGLSGEAGYYRNMRRNILREGYADADKDCWRITARKDLWQGRCTATLSYVPPLAFGVRRYRTKALETDYYSERTSYALAPYNHLLMFSVAFRFAKGGAKGGVVVGGNEERGRR